MSVSYLALAFNRLRSWFNQGLGRSGRDQYHWKSHSLILIARLIIEPHFPILTIFITLIQIICQLIQLYTFHTLQGRSSWVHWAYYDDPAFYFEAYGMSFVIKSLHCYQKCLFIPDLPFHYSSSISFIVKSNLLEIIGHYFPIVIYRNCKFYHTYSKVSTR